jgi:hypothetical protein
MAAVMAAVGENRDFACPLRGRENVMNPGFFKQLDDAANPSIGRIT